jgi:chromosome segregation protein
VYLRRLTINGFKSFAVKTVFEFEPGITAIVGPNGSGKSNVTDAIRWTLGEQSIKQLRMKKSDELVFAGSDNRARASRAEVSLLLDNSDGGLPIDFSEVELTRVIYRSGETDYKLNGRKVRLSEIQQLLAQAGFGQNSYAVIGQGMIDSFIMSTPAERKLLFDEASGIHQYELKREQAQKKLAATKENLTRVRDILRELEPRLKGLEKAMTVSAAREELRGRLQAERAGYVATAGQNHAIQKEQLQAEQQRLKILIRDAEQTIRSLETKRQDIESSRTKQTMASNTVLHQLEIERDELSNNLSVKKAEQQFLIEKQQDYDNLAVEITAEQAQILKLKIKQKALGVDLREAKKDEADAIKALGVEAERIRVSQAHLSTLREAVRETSTGEFISHALAILRHIARSPELTDEQVRDLVARAGRILTGASFGQGDVLNDIKTAQLELGEAIKQREAAHSWYTKAVIRVRAFELDLTGNVAAQASAAEKIEAYKQQLTAQTRTAAALKQRQAQMTAIEGRLEKIEADVATRRLEAAEVQADYAPEAIFELATTLESARNDSEQAVIALKTIGEELDQLKQDEQQLKQTAKAWFGATVPEAEPTKKPLADLEHQLAVLEGRIGDDGDSDVADEYTEIQVRYQFLSDQVSDLETASADLDGLIKQLEGLIKIKFNEAFGKIARNFAKQFERLFGGGKAVLALQPDVSGVYGIEIKVTPPGKRLESLATLSGGERALTGIALLAAILETNPSPFVVLDEIDAALDEANSDRLSEVLAEISKQSQLLVVTHNRAVMASASSIFGVTINEHHISRVLSIKLEDVKTVVAAE